MKSRDSPDLVCRFGAVVWLLSRLSVLPKRSRRLAIVFDPICSRASSAASAGNRYRHNLAQQLSTRIKNTTGGGAGVWQ